MTRIEFLQDEIKLLKSRLEPSDTGHIHTAIFVLEHRLQEEKERLVISLQTIVDGIGSRAALPWD